MIPDVIHDWSSFFEIDDGFSLSIFPAIKNLKFLNPDSCKILAALK